MVPIARFARAPIPTFPRKRGKERSTGDIPHLRGKEQNIQARRLPQAEEEARSPTQPASVASLIFRISSRTRAASSNSRSRACWYMRCSSSWIRRAAWTGSIAA